jgi:PAS domain S-box-containing protein
MTAASRSLLGVALPSPKGISSALLGGLSLVGLGFIAWRLGGGGDEATVTLVTDLAVPAAGLLAICLALMAARSVAGTSEARPWWLLSAALVAYCAADVTWAVLELTMGEPPPVSMADLLYLAFYPIAFVALICWPGATRTRTEQLKMVLDALAIAVVATTVEWILVIEPQLAELPSDPLAMLVTLAYPIGDVILLLAVSVVVSRRTIGWRNLPLLLLIGGIMANLTGDLASGSAWLDETYATGGLADLLFMLFWLLLGAGAVAQGWVAVTAWPSSGDRAPGAVFWLPYVVVVAGLAFPVVAEIQGWESVQSAAVVGAVTLGLIVFVRQVLGAREAAHYAAERARRASEEHFSSLVQQASDVVTVVDAAGCVQFASPSAQRVLGTDRAALVGQQIQVFAVPDDRAAIEVFLAEAASTPDALPSIVWRLEGTSSGHVTVETTAANLLANEVVRGLVLTSRDVTERLRLEDDLAEARRLESVGRLAGGVAHDFNNLLTGIGGFADLIMMDLQPGDPALDDLRQIKEATARGASLTSQLLAFGRRQVVHPCTLDLRQVVVATMPLLRQVVGEAVKLETDLGDDVPTVRADPNQVSQILLNLAANARDAMPDGGEILISVRAVDDVGLAGTAPAQGVEGGGLLLAVSDTGVGMDEVTRQHVFEPFFTTKGVGKGTGLGLASVYGIVRQAGGRTEVESEPGSGTTFLIYWPASRDETNEAAAPDAVLSKVEGSGSILLVEDDFAVCSFAQRVLERIGYSVTALSDPLAALEVVRSRPGTYQLLVSDITMPGMSGPVLAARLAAVDPTLATLFISGNPGTEFGNRLLPKPFTAEQLEIAAAEALAAGGTSMGAAGLALTPH